MYEIDINLIRFPDGTAITWPVAIVTFLGFAAAAYLFKREGNSEARIAARPTAPLPFSPSKDLKERAPPWRVYAVINTVSGVAEQIVLGWDRAKALTEGRRNYITVRLA